VAIHPISIEWLRSFFYCFSIAKISCHLRFTTDRPVARGLPKKRWPKVRFKEKRAVTALEHQAIVTAEANLLRFSVPGRHHRDRRGLGVRRPVNWQQWTPHPPNDGITSRRAATRWKSPASRLTSALALSLPTPRPAAPKCKPPSFELSTLNSQPSTFRGQPPGRQSVARHPNLPAGDCP